MNTSTSIKFIKGQTIYRKKDKSRKVKFVRYTNEPIVTCSHHTGHITTRNCVVDLGTIKILDDHNLYTAT